MKAGTYIFFYDDIQNIIVSQLIEFNGNPLCPLDVDLQPGLNQDKILVSGRTELLFLQRPFEVGRQVLNFFMSYSIFKNFLHFDNKFKSFLNKFKSEEYPDHTILIFISLNFGNTNNE